MTDIKVLLMTLLEEDWGVDFTPQFSTDWYKAKQKMPQVVVSHVLTQPRFMGTYQTNREGSRLHTPSMFGARETRRRGTG